MIDFLSLWAEQIVIVIIITTIIELILPENKIKQYIKTIIGIFIIFTIISPFINIDKISIGTIEEYVNQTIESSKTVNQTSMDNRLQDLYIEEIEKNVIEKTEEEGYTVEKCEVDANLQEGENQGINKIEIKISKKEEIQNQISSIDKISINIGEKVNKQQFTQEEINKLKKKLKEFYQIDENKINISY